MVKWYNSIVWHVTFACVLFIILTTSLTFLYTYHESKKALLQSERNELMNVVSIAASQIKGEEVRTILSLKPGDEESLQYRAVVDHLLEMRKSTPTLANYYIMKKEGEKIVFVVDDTYFSDEEPRIGQEYVDYDPELLSAFSKPAASEAFYTDQWGTFLSGYAPIYDEKGKVVAILGIDMNAQDVMQTQNYMGSVIYFIMGSSLEISALLIFFFAYTLVSSINKMNDAVTKMAGGCCGAELPNIPVKNELYELNENLKIVHTRVKAIKEENEKNMKK